MISACWHLAEASQCLVDHNAGKPGGNRRVAAKAVAIDRVSTFIVQIGAVTPLVNGFVLNGVKLAQLPDWLPWYALAFAMVLHYIAYRQLKRWMPK